MTMAKIPSNVQLENKQLRELKQQSREKRKLQETEKLLRRQLLEQEQQEQAKNELALLCTNLRLLCPGLLHYMSCRERLSFFFTEIL